MPRAQVIARKKSRHGSPALLLVWAVSSTGLGCVDLTPPWQRAGWQNPQNHDSGTLAPPDTLAPPAEAGVEAASVANDDGPTVTPDTDNSTPAIDAEDRSGDSKALDAQADKGTSDTDVLADARTEVQPPQPDAWTDTRTDAWTPQPDTLVDGLVPRLDGGSDSAPDAATADSDDAPLREDRAPDLDSLAPDSYVADLPIDTTSLPVDAGIEALPSQGLVAHYPCENAKGTVLADTSGNKRDATLANGSGATPPEGFTFAAGKVGNALIFSAKDKAYVGLPAGIVSKLSELTIATWVKLNANTAYQRIFDFAVDTGTFMYLTNAGSSGNVRFRISSATPERNQAIEGSAGFPVGTWVHAAVTLGEDGVSIFVDGARVAQQAPAALRASDLGETTNNYIGRSQFAADPYLDGQIDEFRIYDRVLSPAEIANLAGGR
jgi:hypothetical protein